MTHRGEDGFVLADVLVSLIVTSLVIGTLLAAVSRNAIATQRMSDQYRASSYARSKLAEAGSQAVLPEGQSQGRFDALFAWTLTVTRDPKLTLEHEAAPLIALIVELKVSWRRGRHSYRRIYRTLMLRPKAQATQAVQAGQAAMEPRLKARSLAA
jgi:hypothetical protein